MMDEPTSGAGTPADTQGGAVSVEERDEMLIEEEAAGQEELAVTAPDVLADSLGEYLRAWWTRIRSGESGVAPVIAGLVLIVIFFRIEQSTFLSAGNLVNLFVQAAVFILFAAAETYALLLSEIDLSVGAVAGVGAFVVAELIAPPVNLVWWLGIAGGLFVCAAIGVFQGTLITRLHLPSFIVTLGGLLGLQGVYIELANIDKTAVGGVISIATNSPVYNLVNANMSPTLSWIVLIVAVVIYGAVSISGAARRRARGLSAPPLSVVILKVVLAAAGGVAIVIICTVNRGAGLFHLNGVPWVLLLVLLVIGAWSFLLGRTKLGRYIYAIGANPEAARRAGLHAVRLHRRPRGDCIRIAAGIDGHQHRRRQFRAVCRGGGGDRRHQPVRRPRQDALRAAGRNCHRDGVQRTGADGNQRRRRRHRHRDRADPRGHGRLPGTAPRRHGHLTGAPGASGAATRPRRSCRLGPGQCPRRWKPRRPGEAPGPTVRRATRRA